MHPIYVPQTVKAGPNILPKWKKTKWESKSDCCLLQYYLKGALSPNLLNLSINKENFCSKRLVLFLNLLLATSNLSKNEAYRSIFTTATSFWARKLICLLCPTEQATPHVVIGYLGCWGSCYCCCFGVSKDDVIKLL